MRFVISVRTGVGLYIRVIFYGVDSTIDPAEVTELPVIVRFFLVIIRETSKSIGHPVFRLATAGMAAESFPGAELPEGRRSTPPAEIIIDATVGNIFDVLYQTFPFSLPCPGRIPASPRAGDDHIRSIQHVGVRYISCSDYFAKSTQGSAERCGLARGRVCRRSHPGQCRIKIIQIKIKIQIQMSHLADAFGVARTAAGALQRRHEHRRKNCYDRDDDQELDKSESGRSLYPLERTRRFLTHSVVSQVHSPVPQCHRMYCAVQLAYRLYWYCS